MRPPFLNKATFVFALYLVGFATYYLVPSIAQLGWLPSWDMLVSELRFRTDTRRVPIVEQSVIEQTTQELEQEVVSHFDGEDETRPRRRLRNRQDELEPSLRADTFSESETDLDTAGQRGFVLPPAPRRVGPSSFQPIENADAGMTRFFASLARVKRNESAPVVRILHYGDSLIESDLITSTIRRRFQKTFGNAGLGFVLPVLMPSETRQGIAIRAVGNWIEQRVQRDYDVNGYLGLGGSALVALSPFNGSWVEYNVNPPDRFDLPPRRVTIAYLAQPKGASFDVYVNNRLLETVDTETEVPHSAFYSFDVSSTVQQFRVAPTGEGVVRLLGVTLESDTRGIIVDNVGQRGAMVTHLKRINAAHYAEQMSWRNPSLIILSFGANETPPDDLDIEATARHIGTALDHIAKAAPNASYLVMSALDQAVRNEEGDFVSKRSVMQLVQAQRRAAWEHGWAFWNAFDAMGGENAMAAWYQNRPPLCGSDMIHPTPAGMERIGTLFYQAMMAAFANYLDPSHTTVSVVGSSHALQ
jgi:lysophospholipase L1-like esterase